MATAVDALVQSSERLRMMQGAESLGMIHPSLGIGAMAQQKQMDAMSKVLSDRYKETLKSTYGFTDPELQEYQRIYDRNVEEVLKLIGDSNNPLYKAYKTYLDSYPNLYLQMIPREVIIGKLNIHARKDNIQIRKMVEAMQPQIQKLTSINHILKKTIAKDPFVQIRAASNPKDDSFLTDPNVENYQNMMILTASYYKDNPDAKQPWESDFVAAVRQELVDDAEFGTDDGRVYTFGDAGLRIILTHAEIDDALKYAENAQKGTGCQPFGDDFTYTGPKPAMSAAMCYQQMVDGTDKRVVFPGNVRNVNSRNLFYTPIRLPNGQFDWKLVGNNAHLKQFPVTSSANVNRNDYMQTFPSPFPHHVIPPLGAKAKKSKSKSKK
jgi:hypothetical protein